MNVPSKVIAAGVIGFCLGFGLIAPWRYINDTIPFKQESLDFETHSHMKMFVQDIKAFHNGTFDTDTYYTYFSFETRIGNSADYFSRVDSALRDSDWKLLDSRNTFRLYVSEWKRAAPSAYRLEIALHFDSRTRTVSFEETLRYE